jgi:hypothetical protein
VRPVTRGARRPTRAALCRQAESQVVEAAWRYALAFADLDDPNHPLGAVVAVDTARAELEQAALHLRELPPLGRRPRRRVRPRSETV